MLKEEHGVLNVILLIVDYQVMNVIKQLKNRFGECLLKEFLNVETSMKWQCKEGHEWKASYHTIKAGHWCPYCTGKAKHTLEQCQQTAKDRGGKCLSY